MRKNILKSLEPKTKSLFRFKNFTTKFDAVYPSKTVGDTDPTTVTVSTLTTVTM
ncbi:MAG: hypothetical protein ABIN91_15510 [Mucilaginibacter sp.]|uniref:hypothetical protein n=1 Tax=Mucilaginibacter sp. TaxID=1882438 RepID=UPI003267B515